MPFVVFAILAVLAVLALLPLVYIIANPMCRFLVGEELREAQR
jgi:hypothetical protein